MSTKATIASGNFWSLYEEMTDNTVWLRTSNHDFVATPGGVRVLLPPAAIDAIRAAPAPAFPHLRRKAGGGVSRFVPKRGILAACLEAAALTRRERIAGIRRRHWGRLWTAGHRDLDNALWAAERETRKGVTG